MGPGSQKLLVQGKATTAQLLRKQNSTFSALIQSSTWGKSVKKSVLPQRTAETPPNTIFDIQVTAQEPINFFCEHLEDETFSSCKEVFRCTSCWRDVWRLFCSSVKRTLVLCSKNATPKLQPAPRVLLLSEITKFTASPLSLSWKLDLSEALGVCWSLVLSLPV